MLPFYIIEEKDRDDCFFNLKLTFFPVSGGGKKSDRIRPQPGILMTYLDERSES